MIRYRCPHCALLTAAHERRVGQASVCKACLKPHQIPTDTALWLTETGEPLHPPPPTADLVIATGPPRPLPPDSAPEIDAPWQELESVPEPDFTSAAAPQESAPPEPSAFEPAFSAVSMIEPVLEEPASEPAFVPAAPEVVPTVPVSETRAPEPAIDPEPTHEEVEPPTHVQVVASPEPEPVAVATVTPPPQPARKAPAVRPGRIATTVPPAAGDTPPPRYAEPVQLQTQADIAAALTTALTARMKPRAAPRRDLRPSTALWMLLTGIGVAFFLVALFVNLDNRWVTLALGAVQILLGYAWIVRLTHMRAQQRGLLCAIPFVTPYYLAQHKYARLRPLRFVLTGAALAGLALAAPALERVINPLVPKPVPSVPPPHISTQPKLAQLRAHRARGDYDDLVKLLGVLVKTDPLRSADARDRAEIAAELEALCKHEDRAVRLEAMSAFVSWDLDPSAGKARLVCLDAVRSKSEDERVRALFLLPRWKDAETARAAQSLIGRPSRQTNQAKKSLEEIGAPYAEQAALALLKRADDLTVRLLAIDILAKTGGPTAADELDRYALTTDDIGARNSALHAVRVIRERLRPTGP